MRDPLTPLDHSTVSRSQKLHISPPVLSGDGHPMPQSRLHPKDQPPDPALPQKCHRFRNPLGSAVPREASAVGKLPAHSELRWAPPATEGVSSIPQTIETGSHPPRPQSLPARRALEWKADGEDQTPKTVSQTGGFVSSQSQTHVCHQSVLTPKSAMLALRVQPKEGNPWWTCTHLGPQSQEELY